MIWYRTFSLMDHFLQHMETQLCPALTFPLLHVPWIDPAVWKQHAGYTTTSSKQDSKCSFDFQTWALKDSEVESWRPGQQCVAALGLEGCEWEGCHIQTDRLVVRIAVAGVRLIGTGDPTGICQHSTSVSASLGQNISLPVRTTSSSTGLPYSPQNSSHNHFLDHYSVLTRLQLISWNWQPTGNDKNLLTIPVKRPVPGVTAP